MYPAASKYLLEQGLDITPAKGSNERLHHGHASIAILYRWLGDKPVSATDLRFFEQLCAWTGFHHGRLWPMRHWRNLAKRKRGPLGDHAWHGAQDALLNALEELFEPDWPADISDERAWLPVGPAFAGWATLSDWVGSMAEHVAEPSPDESLAGYRIRSLEQAAAAIRAAGLNVRASVRSVEFTDAFPFIDVPRPLQIAVCDLHLERGKQSLILVEAPTGEGKTEAALHLAGRFIEETGAHGLYVAMPSQATSNSLFGRLVDYLERVHPPEEGTINVRLVHGNDMLVPVQSERILWPGQWLAMFDDDDDSETSGLAKTLSWFLPKKRSLLAPYGVGTVDQVFLAVLFSRHFFLRLGALAGKVIIFDEVHAYDVYMSELFARLLTWLKAMGAQVIILSATLPGSARRNLMTAWGGASANSDPGYPLISIVSDGKTDEVRFQATQRQQLAIEWADPEPSLTAEIALTAALSGASVGLIVNTVARAQALYSHLIDDARSEGVVDFVLFHARFPLARRQQIEEAVFAKFGKHRPDGRGCILVATQVAEQSLDLDFDLLITDLAPIDLLLQRAGRLHRHPWRERPTGYEAPRLVVLSHEADEGELPDVRSIGGGVVYDVPTLWRTWAVLRRLGEWHLPRDYRKLIESVYPEDFSDSDAVAPLTDQARLRWDRAIVRHDNKVLAARAEASERMIPSPERLREMVEAARWELAEDDDVNTHRDLRALTRLGPESIQAVCLHSDARGDLYMDPEFSDRLSQEITRTEDLRRLLGNVVRISSPRVVSAIRSQQPVQQWSTLAESCPALKYRYPLIFSDATCKLDDTHVIEYSNDLGIVVRWT